MLPHLENWYLSNGYTLMATSKPAIGHTVHAARVVCDRGLGGVILRTRRIGVPVTRRSELGYFDELNQREIASSEIEAWMSMADNLARSPAPVAA